MVMMLGKNFYQTYFCRIDFSAKKSHPTPENLSRFKVVSHDEIGNPKSAHTPLEIFNIQGRAADLMRYGG